MATDIVTLSMLEDILSLIGQSSDPAGTATLFSRLVQIANFTDSLESLIGSASPSTGGTDTLFKFLKQINDYVDTLETSIGTANPSVGGTDTLFKFLKQINDYVDTLETSIGSANPSSGGTDTLFKFLKQINDLITSRVGNNTDAAGTSTLFARLAQIAGYTDSLEGLIGTNTDAAGTSTIFARLAQIFNIINAIPTVTPQRPRQAQPPVTFTTSSTSLVTALNVQGKGTLRAILLPTGSGSGSTGNHQVQVIADGQTILNFTTTTSGALNNSYLTPFGLSLCTAPEPIPGNSASNEFFELNFTQSLQILVAVPNGAVSQTYKFFYEKEV
jgi:hypothetical protein